MMNYSSILIDLFKTGLESSLSAMISVSVLSAFLWLVFAGGGQNNTNTLLFITELKIAVVLLG